MVEEKFKKTGEQPSKFIYILGVFVAVGLGVGYFLIYQGSGLPSIPGLPLGSINVGNVNGTWNGPFTMKDYGSHGCSYVGTASLTLMQNNVSVTGTLSVTYHVTVRAAQSNCGNTHKLSFPIKGGMNGQQLTFTDPAGRPSYIGFLNSSQMKITVDTGTPKNLPADQTTGIVGVCQEGCGYTQLYTLEKSNK